jgi:uncharacterized membrane protein YfcA
LADISLILLGLAVGILGTLIGAGGGFVLMPILILMWPHENRDIISSLSLAVVFLNALSGSYAYARMKRIDYKAGLMFSAATIPGAIIGARTTAFLPKSTFDTIFGCLLAIVSVYLFVRSRRLSKPSKPAVNGMHRRIVERDGTVHEYAFNPWLGIIISVFVGFLSSLLGIGGGIIHVPVLVNLLGFPVHIATATSHFTLAISALAGTIEHLIEGTLSTVLWQTLFIGIGIVVGAQLGAKLSKKVKDTFIIKGLAVALFVVGVRILVGAFLK